MTSEQGDDASVANAANWLRLIFHSLTCNNPACVLDDRCSGGKALFSHVLTCTCQGACAVPSCTSVRRLTLHWLRCQDTQCRLCAGVWRDLSGSDGTLEQHQHLQPRARYSESLPPEAPGTPERNGAAPDAEFSTYHESGENAGGEEIASSGRGPEQDADMEAIAEVEFDPLLSAADRAVVQLQEATSYMRYLLHSLMCRHSRESAARAPGLNFWLDVLVPQGPSPPHEGPTAGAAAAAAAVAPPMAPLAAAAAASAGRRLLGHRLMCRNSFCALCSGTCELFTRGRALRAEPPVPSGLYDMDHIVHELSLALGAVNL